MRRPSKHGAAAAGDALARYRGMRDFGITPEPQGQDEAHPRRSPTDSGAAFYVQRHDARRLHYDFRLELDGVLRSWAVPKGPSLDPAERRLAVETEDHPLDYGDFEGVIPQKQYGAGDVRLWDRGTWTTDAPDPAAALAAGHLKFRLEGHKLHGCWALVRMHGRGGDDNGRAANWLLIKERDEAAREGAAGEITRLAPASVRRSPPADGAEKPAEKAAKDVAENAAGRAAQARAKPAAARKPALPSSISPQLATLMRAPPAGEGWLWEIKYDGYRLLARLEEGGARLFTRNGLDWSRRLPALARRLAALGLDGSWLDGEIVVPGEDGLPDFQALQQAFEGEASRVIYYVFDAPWLRGQDLADTPLVARKRLLAAALAEAGAEGSADDPIRFGAHFAAGVRAGLEQACRLGLEGLIGKRADAPYTGGRTRTWIKLKCRPRQEFVIGGYTAPGGTRAGFGALLVGLYDGAGALHYAGRVGTGFDRATLERLAARLGELRRDDPPFAEPPPRRPGEVRWVKPTLVAEVEFAGWTGDGLLRQAAFLGLREDKPATAVHEERAVDEAPTEAHTEAPSADGKVAPVRVAGIVISHPRRVIWPDAALTKADLARYYEAVAPWFMPHVAGRPLSLLRCPDGSAAECFFQRHLQQRPPEGLESFVWEHSSGKRRHYLYVTGIEGVIAMVQRGVIEFHTWGASMPRPERPDRITFDLDPGPEVAWAQVVEGARLTRTLLEELGLASFLKTTGGKGLHLVVPLQRRHSWDEVKAFARAAARHLAEVLPERFTASIAKERRVGRIFVDYLRNDDGATAVAAYSARARPGAPVSTPLGWDELDDRLRPADFTVGTLRERLAALDRDPWAAYAQTRQSLTAAMRAKLGL